MTLNALDLLCQASVGYCSISRRIWQDTQGKKPAQPAVYFFQRNRRSVAKRALSFSTLAFLGIFVCLVCDLAVSGAFTWSVPAVGCVLFGWLVLLPVVRSGLGGTVRTLLLCTVLILPLLYLLNCLTPVSLKITALSALFVWTLFFSLKLLNEHLLLCAGVTALLAAGLHIAIQLVLLSSV